jgi:hypothetical protein
MKYKGKESRRSFLKKSAGATAAFIIPVAPSVISKSPQSDSQEKASAANQDSHISAGFAELDITPEIGMEQPGGYGKAYHKTFHDACKVRALVYNDGIKSVALVGIDALIIHRQTVDIVRKEIEKRCGIPYDAILIGASHSHSSGPTGMILPGEFDNADPFIKDLAYNKSSCADAKYLKLVEKQLVEVVCNANKSRVEAKIGIGKGYENKVAFNRRFRMKDGVSFTHPGQLNPDIIEPAGPIDPEVGVIGVWNKEGKCIGCVVNYACHATTSPGGISANWIYYLEQTIRGAMGQDCVVVFLQGACGDVTQVDNLNPYVNPSAEDWCRFVGSRVGAEAVKVLLSMPRGILTPVDFRRSVTEMKRRVPDPQKVKKCYDELKQGPEKVGQTVWTYAKETVLLDVTLKREPVVPVEIQAIQIGPAVFVTNPAEFFCQYGLDIKSQSPFKFTFPVELANQCVGYVPTEEALGPHGGGYETRLTAYSNLEPQAGTRMVEIGVDLAWQMTPGKEPEFTKARPFSGKPWEYGSVKPELS